jgi:hypothetical protein
MSKAHLYRCKAYLYMELHEKAFHIFPWLKKNHYHSNGLVHSYKQKTILMMKKL